MAIGELLRGVTVRATSPNRTVRAVMNGDDGVRVDLLDGAHRLSESGLAGEIGKAVSAALRGYHRACGMVVDEGNDGTPPTVDDELRGFADALEDMAEIGESPRGCVRVRWRGSGDVAVRIRERTFGQLSPAELAGEVERAIHAAMRGYGERAAALYRRTFPPLDVSAGV